MADSTTTIDIRLRSSADTSGVQQMRNEYEDFINKTKDVVIGGVKAEGGGAEFITKIEAEFERLQRSMEGAQNPLEQLNTGMQRLQANVAAMAEQEQRRISAARGAVEQALAEKEAQEQMLETARRRREEDLLADELSALAAKRRIAELQMERELAQSVAQARQMSAEQRIERDVMAQGAYDPREEVARLREVEAGTNKVTAAKMRLKAGMGEAAMQAAFLFDDMQYGIRGVLNNIPMLLMSLGAGTGVAGVVSLAAIAVSQLWDHFGGAKEAAEQTNAAKEKTEELTTAIEKAVEESAKIEAQKFDAYLQALREATELWEKQKGHISEALQYANEMAKAESDLAKATLEIERQKKLAGAKSDEERRGINAEFDARKDAIGQTDKTEAAKRAVEAAELANNTIKARIKDAEGAKNAAEQEVASNLKANEDAAIGIGINSDQARRLGEGDNLKDYQQARLNLMQEGYAKVKKMQEEGGTQEEIARVQRLIDKQQEQYAQAKQRQDELSVLRKDDERAMRTGEGLTFDAAKKASDEARDPISKKRYEEAETQSKAAPVERANAEKAAAEIAAKVEALKLEQHALEEQLTLKKKQQQVAEAESSAAFAKAGADKVAAEQKAAEDARKKQREDEALRLENMARGADKAGDHEKAAKLRGQADKLKLPDDATDAHKEKLKLDEADRLERAREQKKRDADKRRQHEQDADKRRQHEQDAKAGSIGERAGNLGDNLGPAGRELRRAAEKLKDGAKSDEIDAVIREFREIAPLILDTFRGQNEKFSSLLKEMEQFRSQMRNSSGRSSS